MPTRIRRAPDIQKALKLDTKLSWRLIKVARASDPLAAGPYVPSVGSIQAFLQAAARVGVNAELLAGVEGASRDFEEFVRTHAGDRSAFDSMVSALAKAGDSDQVNLQHRRAAFRANRHLWGVQAASRVRCTFMDVGDDPSKVNVAMVDGYVGLRQLRHDAPLIVASAHATHDTGDPLFLERFPLDPRAAGQRDLALLRDFCSEPVPELRVVPCGRWLVYGELIGQGVGESGAITCFTGWRASNAVNRYRDAEDALATVRGTVRMPCEAISIHVITRAGLFDTEPPSLAVHSDHWAELPYPSPIYPMNNTLLADEEIAYLGRGADTLSTTELPRLSELGRYVFDQLGWDGREFDVYRCRLAYPILPSTVAISFRLAEAPAR